MNQPPLAVATDYSAALIIARRWKNRLVAVLLLVLALQIAAFVAVRMNTEPHGISATTMPTSQPVAATAVELIDKFAWLVNVIDFLGIVAVATLCAVLLLLVGIMLVGRLVGVSYITGAFMWCVVLAVLLFPWQALWDYSSAAIVQSSSLVDNAQDRSPQDNWPQFGLPGVLYTWPELKNRAHFTHERGTAAYLGWARFAGWPGVAILLLLVIQRRSGLGLKLALGERQLRLPEGDQHAA